MNCKNHDEREGTILCSVCGENFCTECIGEGSTVCPNCQEKSDISNDILNDILNSVELPKKVVATFDPTDILKQIEDEITLQQEFERLDSSVTEVLNSEKEIEKLFDSNSHSEDDDIDIIIETFEENTVLFEESTDSAINFEKTSESVDSNKEVITEEVIETTTESQSATAEAATVTTEAATVSAISKIKTKVFAAKDAVVDTASSIDTTNAKDNARNLANSTKEQADKLSKEAKVKAAGVAAGVATGAALTKEKAIEAKNTAKVKMNSSKKEMDEILEKIKEENANGEYDHLLGKFTTTYGQDKRENESNDGSEQSALPLRINAIIYFLASLIPGIAQFYLGLTTRGTTILLIAAFFNFVVQTPSLFIITAILSFADAYKLRNIYHRGGKIEDTNQDIIKLIKNPYVIIMIILAIIVTWI